MIFRNKEILNLNFCINFIYYSCFVLPFKILTWETRFPALKYRRIRTRKCLYTALEYWRNRTEKAFFQPWNIEEFVPEKDFFRLGIFKNSNPKKAFFQPWNIEEFVSEKAFFQPRDIQEFVPEKAFFCLGIMPNPHPKNSVNVCGDILKVGICHYSHAKLNEFGCDFVNIPIGILHYSCLGIWPFSQMWPRLMGMFAPLTTTDVISSNNKWPQTFIFDFAGTTLMTSAIV